MSSSVVTGSASSSSGVAFSARSSLRIEVTRTLSVRTGFLAFFAGAFGFLAGFFAAFIVALLGFVYVKTKDELTMRSDRLIASQIGFVAQLPPDRKLDAIDDYLKARQ